MDRERDPLTFEIDLEHLHLDLVAHLDHLAGVGDVLPGHLRDMHEAVHAPQVDKGAECHDRRDHARADLPYVQLVEERCPLFGLLLLEVGPAGEHDVVAVAVQLDDLGLDLLTDEGVEIADPAQLDQ